MHRETAHPVETGYFPLSYGGNPGVKWRILQGCERETLGVGAQAGLPLMLDRAVVLSHPAVSHAARW
jgi:hypothetical protein